MKQVTIQLQDISGQVVNESEITLDEGDTLVMQYPEEMTLQQAQQVFSSLKIGLDQHDVVGVPDSISFKVIKVK